MCGVGGSLMGHRCFWAEGSCERVLRQEWSCELERRVWPFPRAQDYSIRSNRE
jgi:hypothetical protein